MLERRQRKASVVERQGREAPLLQLEYDLVTRSIVAPSPVGHRTAVAGVPFRDTVIDEAPSLFTLSIFFSGEKAEEASRCGSTGPSRG